MNLVEKAVLQGGKLAPLVIPNAIGAMNPSVFIDDDGDILVNVRVVNYTLYQKTINAFLHGGGHSPIYTRRKTNALLLKIMYADLIAN